MSSAFPKPESFFEVRFCIRHKAPSVHGLCIGYERKQWRIDQFVDHIVEWLPEFALSHEECKSLNHANAFRSIRLAARTVYKTKKFANRGEFGELFLHAAIRQIYDSLPAISKIYYKTAVNDTVKGFDAVHVVGPPHEMELWLGEAKFFKNVRRAITAVMSELNKHTNSDYLRDEFMLLTGKIDNSWPHADNLKKLLSPNTSLDAVFKRVCIPVLLTYDSPCLAAHTEISAAYTDAFKNEIQTHYREFKRQLTETDLPHEIRVHLFLFPLFTKVLLIQALDAKLKIWQRI
jgi:hypothetical protein